MDEKDGYTWWDKKNSRSRSAATGREDGDEEFAREVYNVLSKCSQCPSRLAVSTMLPSHQAHMSDPGLTLSRQKLAERAAARAAGTSRRKPSEAGRFEPTGYGSMIRATKSHVIDVVDNVADDDDDDDELAHWKKMMTVRGMVAPLSIKRRFRSRLMLASVHKLKGFAGWKHRRGMGWKRLKASMMEHFVNLAVWRSHFKTIEGRFGTGVLSYFIFVRWLLMLNLVIFLVMFVFVSLPQLFLLLGATATSDNAPGNATAVVAAGNGTREENVEACSALYRDSIAVDAEPLVVAQDSLQGTGWMEYTVMFYGVYASSSFGMAIDSMEFLFDYNLPLAYLLATLAYFLISLILVVSNAGKGLQVRLVSSGDQFFMYCAKVLNGWDYSIGDERAADLCHRNLYFELAGELRQERRAMQRKAQTCCKKFKMYAVRAIANVCVCAVLGAAGYAIYMASDESLKFSGGDDTHSPYLVLLMQFLPSLTITAVSVVVPTIFATIVVAEDYSPEFEIRITLIRQVFVRLAALSVLVFSLYQQVRCRGARDACDVAAPPCPGLPCWETYVGQQLYRLAILDFLVVTATTLLLEYPRRILVTKFPNATLSKFVGQQEFVLPKNVLDIVYTQTLCWLGSFFSPVLPLITVVKCFLFFYLKKGTLLSNYVPNQKPYKASRTNDFFYLVLLLSFILVAIPVGYTIAEIHPSRGCGPFREHAYMIGVVTEVVAAMPAVASRAFVFIVSGGFAVPAFIVLCLALYYFMAVSSAHTHMIDILKEQLILEGRDKQFLLARVTDAGKPPGRGSPAKKYRGGGGGAASRCMDLDDGEGSLLCVQDIGEE